MENIILVVVLHFISVCNIVIVTVMSSEVSYCVSAMAMQDYTHDTYVCSVVVVLVPGLPVFPSYISIHCTDWSECCDTILHSGLHLAVSTGADIQITILTTTSGLAHHQHLQLVGSLTMSARTTVFITSFLCSQETDLVISVMWCGCVPARYRHQPTLREPGLFIRYQPQFFPTENCKM